METNKNNNENKNASTSSQNQMGGFDLNNLINDPKILEILKHLLSGGGAMAGSYFIWIKPLQDKIEALNIKVTEQDKKIKELEDTIEDLTEEAEEEEKVQKKLGGGKDYFAIGKNNQGKESKRKYRI